MRTNVVIPSLIGLSALAGFASQRDGPMPMPLNPDTIQIGDGETVGDWNVRVMI